MNLPIFCSVADIDDSRRLILLRQSTPSIKIPPLYILSRCSRSHSCDCIICDCIVRDCIASDCIVRDCIASDCIICDCIRDCIVRGCIVVPAYQKLTNKIHTLGVARTYIHSYA